MNFTTLIGMLAALCTTVAFFPQALKTWRTKSAGDLSLGTFSIFFAGVVFWLIYGLLITDWPIILANTLTLVLAGSILFSIFKYRNNDPQDQ